MRSTSNLIVVWLLLLGWAAPVAAEFPEMEEPLAAVAKKVAEKLTDL